MSEQSPAVRPAVVRLGPGALLLDGVRDLPLFAAAVEAYRLLPESWARCLDGIAALGFELLEVRAPWSVYERGTGQLDLQGGRPHPQGWSRDLVGFLSACQQRQLAVILAPGPVLGRSVAAGGVPERLWADPAIAARGPRGEPLWVPQPPRPFVQPSLASPVFLEAAADWLRGLAQALGALVHPSGPLVALRLTMQPGPLGRRGAQDGDYHPEAVARYRRFMGERYPDGLPSVYGEAQVPTLEPPCRVTAEPQRVVDWLRFKVALESDALAHVAAAAPALGGLPVLSAQPLGVSDGWGTAQAERGLVAASGLELASLRAQPALERRAFERLAGSSRLPHLAELPWGASCYWGPPEPAVQERRALRALMAGVRGLVFEAVIAHDERVAAPLGLDGRPADTQAYAATRRVLALARELQLHGSERGSTVAILERSDERAEVLAQGLLAPAIPGMWAALGLELEALTDPTPASLTAQAAEALDAAGVAYERLTDELETACWQRFAALIVAGPPDEALCARLADYEAAGGQVFWLDEPDDLPAGLAGRLLAAGFDRPPVRLRHADASVRCVVRSPKQGDGAIFLENGASEARLVELIGVDEHQLWDASRGAPLRGAKLELAAGEVRVLRCRKALEPDETSGAPSEEAPS